MVQWVNNPSHETVGVIIGCGVFEIIRNSCNARQQIGGRGQAEIVRVSERGRGNRIKVNTRRGKLVGYAPLRVIDILEHPTIRLVFLDNQVRGINIGHPVGDIIRVLINVINLHLVGQRHGNQVTILVINIIQNPSIACVGGDDVPINVVFKPDEIAIAALNAADFAITRLGGIGDVLITVIITLAVLPCVQIRPLARKCSNRIGSLGECAGAAIGSGQGIGVGAAGCRKLEAVVKEIAHRADAHAAVVIKHRIVLRLWQPDIRIGARLAIGHHRAIHFSRVNQC